ncbi:MAG TPA: hypothetical protein VFD28_03790 [Candidatus Eisenbacteria bacterium]|nr:hypothetical protein [Candidatus Eisenbacteria bacterium]
MKPKIPLNTSFYQSKTCTSCKKSLDSSHYTPSTGFFFEDGFLPVCNECVEDYLIKNRYVWSAMDKICQQIDIPFVPKEFERIKEETANRNVFKIYAATYNTAEYVSFSWGEYNEEYIRLKAEGTIRGELPLFDKAYIAELRSRWGSNYDDEDLTYLENLYTGLLMTQNISGALQQDQALKVCKLSLEVDSRIREGDDFDKLLSSYDKLVKTAEFTPKNVKNANDFESIGEFFRWLERRGWKNQFYDGVTHDIVDATIDNIQNYAQRLYVNETGIGEEMDRRLEALKFAKEKEDFYGLKHDVNLDNFDNAGYESFFEKETFQEEFDGGYLDV